jgi:hypothetical protein
MSTTLRPQSFENHRARIPPVFLFAGIVPVAWTGYCVWSAIHALESWNVWGWLLGLALTVLWFASRRNAQIVQDRVIRLEMQLRLERVLGPSRREDIARIGLPQLVALRFASDAELPALVDEVLAGKLAKPDDIKRRVKDWQADWLRV